MVIVQLLGGIGNQMFQYAAARRLAFINNAELKLDITSFKNYKLRKYNLGCFNIVENFATRKEIYLYRGFRNRKGFGRIYRVLDRIIPYHKRRYIIERHFHYDPDISRISGNVYLEGYWQNEKYFEDIKDLIREEFKIKHKIKKENEEIKKIITSNNSVSIHIRRGDYVQDPTTSKYHGICSLGYYYDAMSKIADMAEKPYFFVFSDEIEWAKNNLKSSHPIIFVENNKDYEDLRLLSLCKNHIIANSSFSWWGAWLSKNRNKIVFAPKIWFAGADLNTDDFIPKSWYKI